MMPGASSVSWNASLDFHLGDCTPSSGAVRGEQKRTGMKVNVPLCLLYVICLDVLNIQCILLPAVASQIDQVGPVDTGVQERGSWQLAWSDGFGWVRHRGITQVTYRKQVETLHIVHSSLFLILMNKLWK